MIKLPTEWASQCADYLNEEMAVVTVPRFPHLGVLSTAFDANVNGYINEGVFKWIPNRAKYILSFPKVPIESITKFRFLIRVRDAGQLIADRLEDFAEVEISCKMKYERLRNNIDFSYYAKCGTKDINVKTEEGSSEGNKTSNGIIKIDSDEFDQREKQNGKDIQVTKSFIYYITLYKSVRILENTIELTIELRNNSNGVAQHYVPSSNGAKSYYYGILCDLNGEEKINGSVIKADTIKRCINILPDTRGLDTIKFKDRISRIEKIYALKDGMALTEFIEQNRINESIKDMLIGEPFKFNSLRVFQEHSVKAIKDSEKNKNKDIVVITSRTAGGKTEAFLIPLLSYCVEELYKLGTKGLIFYPTKALANDQANRINKYLFYLNGLLSKQGKRKITMGLYHGDIKTDEVDWIPYKCPIKECEERLLWDPDTGIYSCNIHTEVKIDYICSTRNEVCGRVPDIVITNPDTINYMLMMKADAHSIIGRKVKVCPKCRQTYSMLTKRLCDSDKCQGSKHTLILLEINAAPKFIILDEVHLLKGGFGIHVSYLLSRLKTILTLYANNLEIKDYFPCFIGATATIKDPKRFASKFFNCDVDRITIIPDDPNFYTQNREQDLNRVHVFWLPQTYAPASTASISIWRIYKFFENKEFIKNDRKPRILVFVNSIKDANDLIGAAKTQLGNKLVVVGHNTDFDKKARADVEKKFNNGKANVLIATRTLEVGVDFDDVDVLMIFGAPFSYNDYLQRIGRAGRKSNALVVNLFKRTIPVDNYFFENNEFLVDQEKRRAVLEAIPLDRDNTFIREKAIRTSIFDYISTRDKGSAYLDNIVEFLKEVIPEGELNHDAIQEIEKWVISSTEANIQNQEEKTNIEKVVSGFVKDIDKATNQFKTSSVPLKGVFDNLDKKYYFVNIRYSDKEVPISFL